MRQGLAKRVTDVRFAQFSCAPIGGRAQRLRGSSDWSTEAEVVATASILESARLEEVCGRSVSVVRRVVGCCHAAIILSRNRSGPLTFAYPPEWADEVPLSEVLEWLEAEERAFGSGGIELIRVPVSSVRWMVPLVSAGDVLGLLLVGPHPIRDYSHREADALLGIAANTSMALRRACLRGQGGSQNHEVALYHSYRELDETLGRIVARCQQIPDLLRNPGELLSSVREIIDLVRTARVPIDQALRRPSLPM